MGFNSSYRRLIGSSKYQKINKKIEEQKNNGKTPNGHNTILPFFDYEWGTDFSGCVTGSLGGNLTVNHLYDGTYEVKRTPIQYTGSFSDYEQYKRKKLAIYDPELAALEDEFESAFNKTDKDIWKSKYICYDLEEFYETECNTARSVLRIGTLSGILGAFLYLFSPIFFDISNPLTEEILKYIIISLAVFTGVCWFVGAVLGAIRNPLKDCKEEYINKIREKYYRSMINAYGEEMGSILKEYSIIRAKKENKMY